MKTTSFVAVFLVTVFIVMVLAITAAAAPVAFNDPTVTTKDQFGRSVALDGNKVLIGAPHDDTLGGFVGQAHLFDAVTGTLLQTFNDPTVTAADRFGYSVALDGNRVLIGARGDDTQETNVGQAYLFDLTGTLLQTFNDPTFTTVSNDDFGVSVALDGNNVLIGARGDDTLGFGVGQAYLFDALTGNLLQTFNDPTPLVDNASNGDAFGGSVALDGNKVLIGASVDNTLGFLVGQAYLFDLSANLLQTFNDPTVTGTDRFGSSVALDGNNVLIGAPEDNTLGTDVGQAHLFDAMTGNLLQTFDDPTVSDTDRFGFSVALDGNNVLIGARSHFTPGPSNVGQAHLFDAVTGDLLRTFDDPTPTTDDVFGWSVALDGNKVLISASLDDTLGTDVGQAHLFDISDLSNMTGDYDGDDDVDGFDFLLWQGDPNVGSLADWEANYGTIPIQPGDFDFNGEVNGFDFLLWQRDSSVGSLADWKANYGMVAPLSAASAAVPEPASFLLAALAGLYGLGASHRRKRK